MILHTNSVESSKAKRAVACFSVLLGIPKSRRNPNLGRVFLGEGWQLRKLEQFSVGSSCVFWGVFLQNKLRNTRLPPPKILMKLAEQFKNCRTSASV